MSAVPAAGDEVDLLVAGAGPQALTLCAYLLGTAPAWSGRLLVVDRSGWLETWNRQLAAQDIDVLRSSGVHHPHPDPYALHVHARQHGRQGELHGEYGAPSTALFGDFCRSLVEEFDLARRRISARVTEVRADGDGMTVTLGTAPGVRAVRARRMVVATNPSAPVLPAWAAETDGPPGRLAHSTRVDLRTAACADERILVVGGGLTAAQLALGAAARGARPVLVTRAPLRTRPFDATAPWLGQALPGFHAEPSAATRLAAVRAARPGTVPAACLARLESAAATGAIGLRTGWEIQQARWDGAAWRVHGGDGGQERFDRIWLATGTATTLQAEPFLARLQATHPVAVTGGLPDLGTDLDWPGTRLHAIGGLATLRIGPTARNVVGARMAAERIAALVSPEGFAPGRRGRQYPAPGVPHHLSALGRPFP